LRVPEFTAGRGPIGSAILKGERRMKERGERHLNMIHRAAVVGCGLPRLSKDKRENITNAADE